MIFQTIHFRVPPIKVFEALMDEKIHSEFTGSAAKIENKIGGTFSAWDGYATGRTLELVPGKKIVQTWRASDWPSGNISTVTFTFVPEKHGTKLIFQHNNVRAEFEKDIRDGWLEYYWNPLQEYFNKK